MALVIHTQLDPGALDPKELTEQKVMRQFVMERRDQLRYNHDSKQWLIWDKHCWRPDGKDCAFAWALEYCRKLPKSPKLQKVKFASDVERAARAQPEIATENSDWDCNPWLLGTPDGVVDLKTGILRPGKPDDAISKIAICAPAETANCPRWLNFINFALNGNAENIAFLQRYMGYGLTGLTIEEMLLYLVGRPGTGKGTTTKTYTNILRDYATSVPITMFTDASWRIEYYRAKLAGYRVIIAAEPEKGSTWSEAFVNEVTGGDRLSGRHPAGRPFDFDPTHKLFLEGNAIPDLKNVASGLRRRLAMLPFDRAPLVPDPKLKEALREEYPAILRWIIEGCLAWQRDGLKPPLDVRAAVSEYFTHQHVFGRWVEECCNLIPTASVAPNVLRLNYNSWAERNGERTMRSNEFHDAVKSFPDPKVSQGRSDGKRWVKGLVLKPIEPSNDEPPIDEPTSQQPNGLQYLKPGEPRVVGKADADALCVHCNQGHAAGNVLKISDGHPGSKPEPLHIGCGRAYWARRPLF